jgi:hypothetical protein
MVLGVPLISPIVAVIIVARNKTGHVYIEAKFSELERVQLLTGFINPIYPITELLSSVHLNYIIVWIAKFQGQLCYR